MFVRVPKPRVGKSWGRGRHVTVCGSVNERKSRVIVGFELFLVMLVVPISVHGDRVIIRHRNDLVDYFLLASFLSIVLETLSRRIFFLVRHLVFEKLDRTIKK